MEMNCTSNTAQFNTALLIETNGIVKAIGDNQSVSYLFIPDRTDHLTIYKCEDRSHSSIKIEVKLIIRYAPVVIGRFTNETIKCDCDGVPAMYSVYRLEQNSEDGKLVRSVNLNNETFPFNTEMFPYQKNGRYTCVVSNGIPDSNGNALQTWSTNVKYEGSPVFAPENRNVKIGEVGQSITLSFYIYSYPEVEQIFVEKIGLNSIKSNKKQHYTISQSTLRYTEYNNIAGIEGYEILIESDVLDIDDFQTYCITAKNQLGKTSYYFEIIDNENLPLSKSKIIYVVVFCSIATVLIVYMITMHICLYVKHKKTRDQIYHNVDEDHNYHTYDEIGTISHRAVRNIRSSNTNDNQEQHMMHQHAAHISNEINVQPTDDNTPELNADFSHNGLPQSEVNDMQRQRQHMSTTADDTNRSNIDLSQILSTAIPNMDNIINCNTTNANTNRELSNDQKSQSSNDSDSNISNNVMIGSIGDGYENPYQTVLHDRPESHQYVEITRERHCSISSTDFNKSEGQRLKTCSTKE
ncbi:uncharacterized protein LOC127721928 isoform X2 [Mytilus californianus]|uniref:uncharacterized protein LOC127721928 isoform X2 n=1 Tax=Mytilus californianus TaxID=6549 RepID=UPI0022457554|nr:uncharacterized protein LOC127721928 isoform X2 [Mytilus californianus]